VGVLHHLGGGWSFTPNAKYMTGRQAVHLLVGIVAKGGNLLLNVAPGRTAAGSRARTICSPGSGRGWT